MATTSLSLGGHWEELIMQEIKSGRYSTASEVVRDALREFEDRGKRLEALRAQTTRPCTTGIAPTHRGAWPYRRSPTKPAASWISRYQRLPARRRSRAQSGRRPRSPERKHRRRRLYREGQLGEAAHAVNSRLRRAPTSKPGITSWCRRARRRTPCRLNTRVLH